jgi:hypothetical protein
MQDFTDLYIELGEMAASIEGVKWVDLWNEQVNFLEDEFPFQTPAVFFQFTLLTAEDAGELVQKVEWQVDVKLFYETFADTSRGSFNRDTAVAFIKYLNALYTKFHGSSGENYSSMRRIGLRADSTGGAGNMYTLSLTCLCMDYSAQKAYNDSTVADVEIVNEKGAETAPDVPMFEIG